MNIERNAPRLRGRASEARQPLPDPEVTAKATRRRFTGAYKLSVIEKADRLRDAG